MTLRKQAVHGAKWSILQEVVGQLIDFATIIVLARLLGPKDFGLVAMAGVIVSSMRPIIAQGLGVAITQRAEVEDKHLDTAFWANFIFGVLLAAAMALTAKWWALAFSEPALEELMPWLSLHLVFMSLTMVQEAILRREMNFKSFAVRSLAARVIAGGLGVGMAFSGFGIWSLVARFLTTSFISVALLWGISDWRPHFSFSKKHFRDLFPFGVQIMLNELMVFVNRQADTILISYFLGPTALGYYNIAYKLMALVYRLVSQAISMVGMPAFARLQNDKKRLWTAFHDISQLTALIAMPIFLGMLSLAPEMVTVLLGDQWVKSIPILQILSVVGIAHSLFGPMVSILVGAGKAGLRLSLQTIDSITNLAGFAIAVQFGILWVAISYLVIAYLMSPLWLWSVTKVIRIRGVPYFRLIMRPLILSLVMILGIYSARWMQLDELTTDYIFLAASVASGAILYILMNLLFNRSASRKVLDIVKILFSR